MTLMEKDMPPKKPGGVLPDKGRISIRFRNYNIALLALAIFLMFIAMFTAFYNIIWRVSVEYSGSYATSSAYALSAHISKEIALLTKAARSKAVIDWLTDESNDGKQILAFDELSGVVGELHGDNLYVVVEKSRQEYIVESDYMAVTAQPFIRLDENNPEDAWYFKSIASDYEYELSVAMDQMLRRKQVWLDYKVIHNGVPIGIICSRVDFYSVARELFAQYKNFMRGLIIDEKGIINMDSSLLENDAYQNYDFKTKIEDEITNPDFSAAITSHLNNIDGYFMEISDPTVIKLSLSPYRYATIVPIRFTNWSAVILLDSSSSFNISLFLPALITVLVLLIAFDLANNKISHQLIFLPLKQLIASLKRLKEDEDEDIYGIDRDDEFGNLSNTIWDLFTKANYDALTGLHNRRFMENNLQRLVGDLSRPRGLLSVLMIDIDYFKKYNDAYGHEQGDVCLKIVSRALESCITRKSDFVARYGGEEFLTVLPNTDEYGARVIAQKMLDCLRRRNLPHADSAVAKYVTVSIGVTTGKVTYPQSWEDYSKRADEALYMSKQNGRDQYTFLGMDTDFKHSADINLL